MKAEIGAHVACNVVCESVPLGRTDKVRYSLACDEPDRHHDRFRERCVFLELK